MKRDDVERAAAELITWIVASLEELGRKLADLGGNVSKLPAKVEK